MADNDSRRVPAHCAKRTCRHTAVASDVLPNWTTVPDDEQVAPCMMCRSAERPMKRGTVVSEPVDGSLGVDSVVVTICKNCKAECWACCRGCNDRQATLYMAVQEFNHKSRPILLCSLDRHCRYAASVHGDECRYDREFHVFNDEEKFRTACRVHSRFCDSCGHVRFCGPDDEWSVPRQYKHWRSKKRVTGAVCCMCNDDY